MQHGLGERPLAQAFGFLNGPYLCPEAASLPAHTPQSWHPHKLPLKWCKNGSVYAGQATQGLHSLRDKQKRSVSDPSLSPSSLSEMMLSYFSHSSRGQHSLGAVCHKLGPQAKQKQPSQRWKLFARCRPDFVITLWVTCSGFFPAITPPCPWGCHLRFRDSSAPILPSPARGDLCSQRFFYPSCIWGSISFVRLLQS